MQMLQALQALELTPTAILVTHRHWDHVGGVDRLAERFAIPVFAPQGISGCTPTHSVRDKMQLSFGKLKLQVLALPGHTLEHVGYVITTADPPLAFVGDTLFGAGCGRMFEGTAAQMWQSISRLLALPDTTYVYCAHEYTRANMQFAHTIEPNNQALQQRMQQATHNQDATIPSNIALEKATNPFCRVPTLATQQAWRGMSEEQIFGKLRALKDNF